VVSIGARAGDAAQFDRFFERFRTETDPAFRRRFLVALAAFEAPEPAGRAQELIFTDTIPLQDLATFAGSLLGNRSTREGFWKKLREQWEPFTARLSGAPMLLRRVIEGMGNLTERRHLEEAEALLADHPVEAAQQATAQTLERMRQDVALRERTQGMISAWLGRD
jgi:puromycin-sensitive aminopeptidase